MNNNNKKSMAVTCGAITVGVFAVFTAVVFALFGFADHSASFWLSYVFNVIAFFAVIGALYLIQFNDTKVRDRVLNFPIAYHCVTFIVVDIVLSIIFMVIDEFAEINWGIPFSIHLIVLTAFVAVILACFKAKQEIIEVQQKVKAKTAFMYMLRTDADVLANAVADPQARQAAEKLAENLRYSDPVSNEYLDPYEMRIRECIATARTCANYNDYTEIINLCNQAQALLDERNAKCAALK